MFITFILLFFFIGFGYARLDAGQEITFDFTVPVTTKYFMLLRYSLYQLEWFSQILPQGREVSDWTGGDSKDLYLKKSDQPMQWLFSVTIFDDKGQIAHALTFTVQDLSIGNARFWLSRSSFMLQANVAYKVKFVYEASSKAYGQPWPLLLDSLIFMLDYKETSYFTGFGITKRLEIFDCFTQSKDLRTARKLPGFCEMHIFTVDLQLYQKALSKCVQTLQISLQ